jgi:hypothetical protein
MFGWTDNCDNRNGLLALLAIYCVQCRCHINQNVPAKKIKVLIGHSSMRLWSQQPVIDHHRISMAMIQPVSSAVVILMILDMLSAGNQQHGVYKNSTIVQLYMLFFFGVKDINIIIQNRSLTER